MFLDTIESFAKTHWGLKTKIIKKKMKKEKKKKKKKTQQANTSDYSLNLTNSNLFKLLVGREEVSMEKSKAFSQI